MKWKEHIINSLVVLGISFIIVGIIFLTFNNNNCCMCGAGPGCCPCPSEYFDEVKDWCNETISSAGSYKFCCDLYKLELNKSFECFR